MKKFLLPALICPWISLASPSEEKIQTLYSRLDPLSIPQQLSLYELYPESNEGQKALNNAWRLLSQSDSPPDNAIVKALLGKGEINAFVDFLLSMRSDSEYQLSPEELKAINTLSHTLSNRKLKGFYATNEEEVLALPPHEVDVSQALLLSLFGNDLENREQMLQYNAMLDVMALQIRAHLIPDADHISKINAISQFIFHEMRFRFPPESLYAKSIDFYTFLPSVLQSRKGVCLGVSTLYLCLAQRLDLNLEIITPPGHIYLRYNDGDSVINIETTARGIHLPSEKYLSINTRELQKRNAKEVVGMNYFNQAAIFWQHKEHDKAIEAYEKALLYTPKDALTIELLAYNYLASGQQYKARQLLQSLPSEIPYYMVAKETF
ncbi:MAG: regulator of sirC expression with transglutaminase-like and TPR domain, partial [Chlamydiales bacterium]